MTEETSINSTSYEIRRYCTPSSITASHSAKRRVSAVRKKFLSQPLTYKTLLEDQERQVLTNGLKQQTAANRATALRKFMAANNLSIDDVVGSEMRMGHPEALERFLTKLRDEGKSSRAISNTRCAFRPWKEAVVVYDTMQAIDSQKNTPFVEALKSLFFEKNIALVAKQSGVPKGMLYGWLNGKVPRASNVKHISRLESFFAIERNSLVEISGAKIFGNLIKSGVGESAPIEYRNIVSQVTRNFRRLSPGASSPLRKQWSDFLIYKTSATLGGKDGALNVRVNGKKRTRRGKWRFSPCPLTYKSDKNWWAFLPTEDPVTGEVNFLEVASARMNWGKTSSYLGWLRLDKNEGGAGMEAGLVETLAWLAHPEFIEKYLDWMKGRLKSRNRGATQFLAFIASLVRPKAGYLRQCPELAETLPENYRWVSWDEMCDATFELTEDLVSAYDDELRVSRDSFEPIMHILQLPQPMDAMVDMIQRMRANRPIANPMAEAVWGRDMVLIKILCSNPLRRRNLAYLTWREDNTGELHQRSDGSWWIKIHKTKFKNTRGAAGAQEYYECQVNQSAWSDIERYVRIYRPKLLRAPSDLFFVTSHAGPYKSKKPQSEVKTVPWIDLSKRVSELTARYLYKCPGIGCHAFRHIVATSILKAPGGDFKTAALVLYDKAVTVEKHYAFLTANQGGERMSELLKSSFSRM